MQIVNVPVHKNKYYMFESKQFDVLMTFSYISSSIAKKKEGSVARAQKNHIKMLRILQIRNTGR
jgi:hypothetical protein